VRSPSLPESSELARTDIAAELGFEQFVHALRRTLMSTPVGWALAAWATWSRVPPERLFLWLAGFAGTWAFGLWLIAGILRDRPRRGRHAGRLLLVATLDGLAWGAVGWLLTGFDPTLDPWLGSLLCGVAAVNAPSYITYFRAYVVLIGAMWLIVVLAGLLPGGHAVAREVVVGFSIFCVMIVYHMRLVGRRVLDGIGLQLRNASLAEQLRDALQLVQHEADTDVLTGQPNRRALDALLARQVLKARVDGCPFSVLLIDIDHFKLINDTHGHAAGDDTLRAFAHRVRAHLREGDACARYGGEEFVVVLPGTTLVSALEIAERLRHGVAEVSLMSVPHVRTTVSIGVAQCLIDETPEQLLKRADQAVYAAKRGGRNQVCVPDAAPMLAD
jgi:diguanylate cyclase (GGDEF)-like protein